MRFWGVVALMHGSSHDDGVAEPHGDGHSFRKSYELFGVEFSHLVLRVDVLIEFVKLLAFRFARAQLLSCFDAPDHADQSNQLAILTILSAVLGSVLSKVDDYLIACSTDNQ